MLTLFAVAEAVILFAVAEVMTLFAEMMTLFSVAEVMTMLTETLTLFVVAGRAAEATAAGGGGDSLQPAAGAGPGPDGHQDRPPHQEQDHPAGGSPLLVVVGGHVELYLMGREGALRGEHMELDLGAWRG